MSLHYEQILRQMPLLSRMTLSCWSLVCIAVCVLRLVAAYHLPHLSSCRPPPHGTSRVILGLYLHLRVQLSMQHEEHISSRSVCMHSAVCSMHVLYRPAVGILS